MYIKLRKQLSLDSPDGGGLDSPNGGSDTVATIDAPAIDAPVIAREESADNPLSSSSSQQTEHRNADEVTTDSEGNQLEREEGAGNGQEQEVSIWQLAEEQLGLGLDVSTLGDGVDDGLVVFGKAAYEKGGADAVAKEFDEIAQISPDAIELIRWKRAGGSEREFYLSKIEAPTIDPETLETADPKVRENIIYNNFVKQGLGEEMAKILTQQQIDSNNDVALAKHIVNVENKKSEEEKQRQAELTNQQIQQQQQERIAAAQAREAKIKGGNVGGSVIPLADREAFADANLYDAGNPEFPGMSAVDIKIAQMTQEEHDAIRFILFKGGVKALDTLVKQRATSISVSGALGKGRSTSTMSGGTNNRGVVSDNRKLDSPNS